MKKHHGTEKANLNAFRALNERGSVFALSTRTRRDVEIGAKITATLRSHRWTDNNSSFLTFLPVSGAVAVNGEAMSGV